MVASWSTKRRLLQGGVFVIVVSLLVGFVFWQILYKSPTCSDGKRNGDETGIDCGGSCKNLCTVDTLNPVVIWSKVFNISGDVYTAVAYIENPNTNSKNLKASYQFSIFDDAGKLIITKDGETSIPKGKKFAVFETGIVLKGSKPRTADFRFIKFGPWEKDGSKEPDLDIKYGTLQSTSTNPKIIGTITNDTLQNISSLEMAVFVLDGNENVVAASNTFIDNLDKRTTQDFVFTWPKPFNLGAEVCAAPINVVLSLDRSGSMKSESVNPPEPFTTVINTARDFVKNLTVHDAVSVVSFGTQSKTESSISFDKKLAIDAISRLYLSTTTVEQTNIYGGLNDAVGQFDADATQSAGKRAIVLLTDGIPTEPVLAGSPKNPVIAAQNMANEIKAKGIEIYTIGLGKDVDENFLKSISTDDSHYFNAPNKETLSNVYSKISKSLCPKKPNVINIIYRTLK